MIKKISFIAVLPLFLLSSYAFAQPSKANLFSIKQNGSCGYINKSGKVVIPPQFNTCWNFSEGFAGVIVHDKLGFIDETGNFFAQPQFNYDLVWFSEGFATIRFGKQIGFVDSKGQINILPEVTSLYDFSEGLASFE